MLGEGHDEAGQDLEPQPQLHHPLRIAQAGRRHRHQRGDGQRAQQAGEQRHVEAGGGALAGPGEVHRDDAQGEQAGGEAEAIHQPRALGRVYP